LFTDVVSTVFEAIAANVSPFKTVPIIVGGRYGLSSKDLLPAWPKRFSTTCRPPKPKGHFTIGINDDVGHTSLAVGPPFSAEPKNGVRALFYGLGSDGTVSANKNSIKIIGENTEGYAQGYFVYDSKKAGSITISHLRFGRNRFTRLTLFPRRISSGIHNPVFLERFDLLDQMKDGGTVLLKYLFWPTEIWDQLPGLPGKTHFQETPFLCDRRVCRGQRGGFRGLINTVMQSCFSGSPTCFLGNGPSNKSKIPSSRPTEKRRRRGSNEFAFRGHGSGTYVRSANSRHGHQR
jgi:pyruvate-ferredoxin/flavodoxin oxidoreductase